MPERFEDQYLDVLQNIEVAIVSVYGDHPELSDYNVDKALGGLVRTYQAQAKERAEPDLKLRELEQAVYNSVKAMCDWRLGAPSSKDDEEAGAEQAGIMAPKTLNEIIACLKRIRKSVDMWTKKRGRQGYLTYISDFLAPHE
jgi:hypothetical protein